MCGSKQTVKREFFRGSGAACRQKVQQLNFEKHQNAEQESAKILKLFDHEEIESDTIAHLDRCQPKTNVVNLNKDCPPSSSELLHANNVIKGETTSQQKIEASVAKTKWETFACSDENKDNISTNAKVSKWTNFL